MKVTQAIESARKKEVTTEYRVFVRWKDGKGGTSVFLDEQLAWREVERYRRRGYDKPDCPVEIWKVTLEQIR